MADDLPLVWLSHPEAERWTEKLQKQVREEWEKKLQEPANLEWRSATTPDQQVHSEVARAEPLCHLLGGERTLQCTLRVFIEPAIRFVILNSTCNHQSNTDYTILVQVKTWTRGWESSLGEWSSSSAAQLAIICSAALVRWSKSASVSAGGAGCSTFSSAANLVWSVAATTHYTHRHALLPHWYIKYTTRYEIIGKTDQQQAETVELLVWTDWSCRHPVSVCSPPHRQQVVHYWYSEILHFLQIQVHLSFYSH